MDKKPQIFISYSHKDRAWLDRLMPFLQPLVRDDELKLWSDTDIRVSSDWHAEIQKALNESDAAILLISQDFLASDYIRTNELPHLLSAASQHGLHIFPVFVSSTYIKKDSPLLRFQGPNSKDHPLDLLEVAKQNVIFVKLVEAIDELLTVTQVGITEEWLMRFRARFVQVEGGTFLSGDNELNGKLKALKEEKVRVRTFQLGQYAVTQSEWIALMNTQPWLNERNVRYGNDIPAVFVTLGDVMRFIGKINKLDSQFAYRLPCEEEWEYAARGGLQAIDLHTKFCFGNDENKLMEYGWYKKNAFDIGDAYAHPVGELKGNQLNVFDMHGNIWEWTSEADETSQVVHGGGFNAGPDAACSAYRLSLKPEMKSEALGFRLVQEPK